MFTLNKFSLIITTRCNLRCKLCCEYITQNKPFPDMAVGEAEKILVAVFKVCDKIGTVHLTGGGEPFLHPELPGFIEAVCRYSGRFDSLMIFTNSTLPIGGKLLDIAIQYKDQIVVQVSQYGVEPEMENNVLQTLLDNGIKCKIEKYYGEKQSFGGWVDFGRWEKRGRAESEIQKVFSNCAVTRDMRGNWRTRDGKVHWCSRSQRGMELESIPDSRDDYVDLFDDTTCEEKQQKFRNIMSAQFLAACDYCSGDQGTKDTEKRFPAAEQL